MRNPNYSYATNAAYRVLTEIGDFSLATDVFAIAEALPKCKIVTYSQAKHLTGITEAALLRASDYGFTIINRRTDERVILYNEKLPLACIRFTVAHEIGHAVLCHSEAEESWEEKEANCFARNLLCPIPVVCGLGLTSSDDYVSVFNVSATAAEIAYRNRTLDSYHITKGNFDLVADMLHAYMFGFSSLGDFYQYMVS